MTKQEKIIEAWQNIGATVLDYIDDNGFVSENRFLNSKLAEMNDCGLYEIRKNPNEWMYRPKELEGIEDNNGWIPFTHEKLPPNTDYHVTNSRGKIIVLSSNVMNSITINSLADLTHYRPIPIPKPPVY